MSCGRIKDISSSNAPDANEFISFCQSYPARPANIFSLAVRENAPCIATGVSAPQGAAVCDRAVYLTTNRTITLTGDNIRLQKDKNEITGKKIIIHQNTGEITVEGDPDSRVNAIFHPENDAQYFDFK